MTWRGVFLALLVSLLMANLFAQGVSMPARPLPVAHGLLYVLTDEDDGAILKLEPAPTGSNVAPPSVTSGSSYYGMG